MAIDSVEDMKLLFDGIPLGRNVGQHDDERRGAAGDGLLHRRRRGAGRRRAAQLTGTIQNDILKEFAVRNTYIYPPEPSMRIVSDIIAYTRAEMPKFNSISISRLSHARGRGDGGAGARLHAGRRHGICRACAIADGLDIDAFAPRLSFFFGIGMNLFMEVAKLRAARTLWARIMTDLGAKSEKSKLLRTHCQTSGVSA